LYPICKYCIYRYPFSVATHCPKIPDGKASLSNGLHMQHTGTFNGETHLFVVSPTFGNMLLHSIDGSNWTFFAWGEVGTMKWSGKQKDGEPTVVGEMKMLAIKNYIKYHHVSKGLQLRCTSSDDHTDGYWEAVWLPTNELARNFALGLPTSWSMVDGKIVESYFSHHTTFLPTNEMGLSYFAKTKWLLNPTYQSGKLENLHNFDFSLVPQKIEHDFVDMPKELKLNSDDFSALLEEKKEGKNLNSLFGWGYYVSFDTIVVKVQGRLETKIHAHAVVNLETCHANRSVFIDYQTEVSTWAMH
jgi:hypothetical protein